ncbi:MULTISPECIES: hypothetical protein [Streptomyces]|uniref:Uncharacterized protein n=2 Tax=Streptomyces TaxID=1883 RepID=A0ABV9J6X6_9ACTN
MVRQGGGTQAMTRRPGRPTKQEAECAAFQAPGHGKGIPEGEAVIRIPARMVHMIREACDAVERATVQ